MSTNGGMHKEDVVCNIYMYTCTQTLTYTYNGILFIHKKE